MLQKHLDLLDRLGTSSQVHILGSLRNHLIGTYKVLVEWGNPEYIAVGGLFHSIYGTQTFKVPSISLEERSRIREAIGLDAENLAYLFCVTERQGFFYEAEKPEPILWDCVHHQLISTTPQTIRDLIEIEVANAIELRSLPMAEHPHILSRRKHMLTRSLSYMSPAARVAFVEMMAELKE
ncbi:MAG: DUF6817 domain-containing protein [Cyanobacteria bacterium P01_E01_bin.42]